MFTRGTKHARDGVAKEQKLGIEERYAERKRSVEYRAHLRGRHGITRLVVSGQRQIKMGAIVKWS